MSDKYTKILTPIIKHVAEEIGLDTTEIREAIYKTFELVEERKDARKK